MTDGRRPPEGEERTLPDAGPETRSWSGEGPSPPGSPTPVGELLARVAARAPRKPRGAPGGAAGDRVPARMAESSPSEHPAPVPPRPDASVLAEIRAAVVEGWAPVPVLGGHGVGKSAFVAAGAEGKWGLVGSGAGSGRAAGGAPDRLEVAPLRRGRLRRLLVEVPEGPAGPALLRELAPAARGLIVLVDLAAPIDAAAESLVRLRRALLELRWGRGPGRRGGRPPADPRALAREVAAGSRRLGFPVQALFSRADRLVDLPVAAHRPGLFPAGEDPLLVAWHLAPGLVDLLGEHARRFRFDFVHAFVPGDLGTGAPPDPRPCGVDGALEWLLRESSPFAAPALASSLWIRLLRRRDRRRGRRGRWRRLPPPRSLL